MENATLATLVMAILALGIGAYVVHRGKVSSAPVRKEAFRLCSKIFRDLVIISPTYRYDLKITYSVRSKNKLMIILHYKGQVSDPENLKTLTQEFIRAYPEEGPKSFFKTISVSVR